MNVLTIGSLNLDHVYRVRHFVRPGETILSEDYSIFCGGKGLNQSIALARAGAAVRHAALIGPGSNILLESLRAAGVGAELIEEVETPTGHAIIQVNDAGENCIVLYGGANQALTPAHIDKWLDRLSPGDLVLLQNETNLVGETIERASERGLAVCFNAAPCSEAVRSYPLEDLAYLFVNETEATNLFGAEIRKSPGRFHELLPQTAVIMTLGADGAVFSRNGEVFSVPAVKVDVVDSTAAGDTFIGYFLAGVAEDLTPIDCLNLAARAAAIAVTRKGAASSIPLRKEVDTPQKR